MKETKKYNSVNKNSMNINKVWITILIRLKSNNKMK